MEAPAGEYSGDTADSNPKPVDIESDAEPLEKLYLPVVFICGFNSHTSVNPSPTIYGIGLMT